MKQSHKWKEAVDARCPYCHKYSIYANVGDVGDILKCPSCHKQFGLGGPTKKKKMSYWERESRRGRRNMYFG